MARATRRPHSSLDDSSLKSSEHAHSADVVAIGNRLRRLSRHPACRYRWQDPQVQTSSRPSRAPTKTRREERSMSNAGMLHRVGPYRLHVRLARDLARMGFSSLRVDLADTGDSPLRPGLTYTQSVAADFSEITAPGVAARSITARRGRTLLRCAPRGPAGARAATDRRHGSARSDLFSR
jgi:hypothetical protein